VLTGVTERKQRRTKKTHRRPCLQDKPLEKRRGWSLFWRKGGRKYLTGDTQTGCSKRREARRAEEEAQRTAKEEAAVALRTAAEAAEKTTASTAQAAAEKEAAEKDAHDETAKKVAKAEQTQKQAKERVVLDKKAAELREKQSQVEAQQQELPQTNRNPLAIVPLIPVRVLLGAKSATGAVLTVNGSTVAAIGEGGSGGGQ
jgi:ATPase subunit of ABC transporter with duplicated ATPase domains